jgi:hypothetical protein
MPGENGGGIAGDDGHAGTSDDEDRKDYSVTWATITSPLSPTDGALNLSGEMSFRFSLLKLVLNFFSTCHFPVTGK